MNNTILDKIMDSSLIRTLSPAGLNKEYALILGGGGAKGAYELGVMKALLDLDVRLKGVYGTSIGALNGAFLVAGKMDQLFSLWSGIKLTDIFKMPDQFV
ncbi:MAG: patatin-like phospholipase family protein, partial [bacterium]|nr:patatin-like phospholipase family protein [bacterium]